MLIAPPLNSLVNNPDFSSTSVGEMLIHCPLGFVDIGARGGAHDIVFDVARNTSVLAFEPDTNEYARLIASKEVSEPWADFQLRPLALSARKSSASLHLLKEPNNNSLLEPNNVFVTRYNMSKWLEVGSRSLETVTLDSVIFGGEGSGNNWGEFVKLDTQGTEFDILVGASRTLTERCVAIVTEVSFCQLYKHQKSFSDVEHLLRQYGFAFYGFRSMHTRSCKILDKKTHASSERLIYADAVFFKDPLSGSKVVDLTERQQKILFLTATLLNYHDFALELPRKTWLRDKRSSELDLIERLIKKRAELSIQSTISDVHDLARNVNKAPHLANVIVGDFVDRRRMINNYDDILNVIPLPRGIKADES